MEECEIVPMQLGRGDLKLRSRGRRRANTVIYGPVGTFLAYGDAAGVTSVVVVVTGRGARSVVGDEEAAVVATR